MTNKPCLLFHKAYREHHQTQLVDCSKYITRVITSLEILEKLLHFQGLGKSLNFFKLFYLLQLVLQPGQTLHSNYNKANIIWEEIPMNVCYILYAICLLYMYPLQYCLTENFVEVPDF